MAFYHPLQYYANDLDYPSKASWIAARLLTLRHDLNVQIKSGRATNSLIIGSWNIRAFDGGVPRLDESYHYIAEIIGNFDICAIQEVKGDLAPLSRLIKLLGPQWDYFVTDVSVHKGGNSERMAFVYNTSSVYFRNLIGEIVLPRERLVDGEQIARSPFFASFQADWFKFSLCSSHIIYGNSLKARADEISVIAEMLVKRAKTEDQVHIFLGDMNIESKNGEVMRALKDSKLTVPDFGPTNLNGDRWFDQIAFTEKGKAKRKTRLLRHGVFDWRHSVYGPHPDNNVAPPELSAQDNRAGKYRPSKEDTMAHYKDVVTKFRAKYKKEPYANWTRSYKNWATFEMSDHLPVWIELEIDYSDDYLSRFL